MEDETEFFIGVLSHDPDDTRRLVDHLRGGIGEKAKVKILKQDKVELPTRDASLGLALELISVTITGVHIATQIALLLSRFQGRPIGVDILIQNKRGQKVRIRANDSFKTVKKKLLLIAGKRGWFQRLFARRKKK